MGQIEKYIPVLSMIAQQEILDFYEISKIYHQDLSDQVSSFFKSKPDYAILKGCHDEFFNTTKSICPALKDKAIRNGEWEPYLDYKLKQAFAYASMGVSIQVWFGLYTIERNLFSSLLSGQQANFSKWVSALDGMNRIMDIEMAVISDAYLLQRDEIILSEKIKIETLELEREQSTISETEEINYSNELYFDMFEGNPAGMAISSISDGKLITVNNTFLSIFGFPSKEAVLEKTTRELDLWPKLEDRKLIVDFLNSSDPSVQLESKGQRMNSSMFWMAAYFRKISIYNIPCLMTCVLDITERKFAEEQLQQYKYFFNNSNDLCLISNMGYFEIINPTLKETLGYKEEELRGTEFLSFLHPEDVSMTLKEVEKLSRGAKTVNFTNRCRKKNGDYILIDWNANADSPMDKMYAVGRDITERTRIIQQAEESNQKFLKLFYSSPVAMVISDIDTGVILDVNEQYENVFGFSKAEVLGKTGLELGIFSNVEFNKNIREQASKVKSIKNIDATLYNSNKEPVEVNLSLEIIVLENKDRLFSVILDITERKKMEKALQSSEEKFRNLVNFSPVGITLSTLEGKILEANPAVLEMTGFETIEELMNTPGKDLYVDQVDREHIIDLFRTEGLVKNMELRLRKKNGDLIWINSRVIPFKMPDGNTVLLSTSSDITEIKRSAEQLWELNKEMESFSYSVSHDLRAPLRAINGFAKILEEDYGSMMDEEGLSCLHTILKNSKKMGELIDALLAFSRLGRKEVSTSEIDMRDLVKIVCEEAIADSAQKIEFSFKDILSAAGDKLLIKQVWVNLISNAIKYSSKRIQTQIEVGSYIENYHVVYYVKDNGVGFDMLYYDKLFKVFHRLHSQEDFEGTGIGLANVYRIIIRHGGKVWSTAKVNKGAIFYFSLPLVNS